MKTFDQLWAELSAKAAEHEGRDRTAEEVSQLLYHVQVLLLASGVGLDDVYAHL